MRTVMTAPLRLPDGRFVLPGNRWDLLDGVSPAQPPSVSVVIPHFNAQRQLDRLLSALSRQTHPLTRLEVIVADDGSAEPPIISAMTNLDVRVLSQADAGFRAAAARNLGAAAASGEVLCFLDVDTVPEPGYLQGLSRLPALAPDALVTGRRRHADLAVMSEGEFESWLDGTGPGPVELPEPQWLIQRHKDSGNLLRLGRDSYRFVLSAVLGCSRSLFVELGGFDETFVRYGGEDWEFAHRALCAGAVLAHVPDAVAWHDGGSWAERGDEQSRRQDKNAETQTLTGLIPDPAFGGRAWAGRPEVIVEIATEPDHGCEPAAVAVAVHSVLAGDVDAGIWLRGAIGAAVKAAGFALDPRVISDPVSADAAASARIRVACSRPLRVDVDAWQPLLERVISTDVEQLVLDTGDGVMTISASRAVARAARWASALEERGAALFGLEQLAAAEHGVSAVARRPDLAHELAHLTDRTRLSQ